MTGARERILQRIRDAVSPGAEGATRIAAEVATPERAYRTKGESTEHARLDLFLERVEDYRVATHRCAEGALAGTIARLLAKHDAHRIVIPADLDSSWIHESQASFERDADLSNDALDTADGVLTTCAVAIAETGTIVLDGGAGQGRRVLTLLPDYHLCIVPAGKVVETVPEAVERLAAAVRSGRPLTMISGPSATSDIELSRVEGVHGPRTLEVVLVDAS